MRTLILMLLMSMAAVPARAYDILLDIDTDGSPYTINTETDLSPAQLRLVLRPSEPGEWIGGIAFGLGGTCWECFEWGVPYTYGTECDLYLGGFGEWIESDLFASSWSDISLCLGCCNGNGDGEGYHHFFEAAAADGGFALTESVFIASFSAWVKESSVFDRCPHPPSDLITFPLGGPGSGNAVQITDEFTPTAASSWSAVKSLY